MITYAIRTEHGSYITKDGGYATPRTASKRRPIKTWKRRSSAADYASPAIANGCGWSIVELVNGRDDSGLQVTPT